MSEMRAFYAILPANVRYDKDLPPTAKLVYAEITALCNEKGYCWAQNKYFEDLYDISRRTIINYLNILEKKGYIVRENIYKEGTKEIIARHIRLPESMTNNNSQHGENNDIDHDDIKENDEDSAYNVADDEEKIPKEASDYNDPEVCTTPGAAHCTTPGATHCTYNNISGILNNNNINNNISTNTLEESCQNDQQTKIDAIARKTGWEKTGRFCPKCFKPIYKKRMSNSAGEYWLLGHPDFRTGGCSWTTKIFTDTLSQADIDRLKKEQSQEQKENIKKFQDLAGSLF